MTMEGLCDKLGSILVAKTVFCDQLGPILAPKTHLKTRNSVFPYKNVFFYSFRPPFWGVSEPQKLVFCQGHP